MESGAPSEAVRLTVLIADELVATAREMGSDAQRVREHARAIRESAEAVRRRCRETYADFARDRLDVPVSAKVT